MHIRCCTVRFKLTADCDLDAVVARCPLSLTGADFYALCSDAMLNAMKREIEKLETGVCASVYSSESHYFVDAKNSFEPLTPKKW